MIQRAILSIFAGAALSLGLVLPAFAAPAILSGLQPGSRVNVRSAPSTAASSPHYGLVGDRVDVLDEVQGRDRYTWYYVRFGSGAEGWIRGDFVRFTNSSSPTSGTGILNGGSAGARVNVRSAPTVQASSPHYGINGDQVRLLRYTQGSDGYRWYYVRFASGAEGWIRGDLVDVI